MIAIDTNILLRYLLNDDVEQSNKASTLINGKDRVLITETVLVETIWTLRGKKYKLDKAAVVNVVNALFEEPNIIFEDSQTVWRALGDFTKAKAIKVGNKRKEADFADALVVNKALYASKQMGVELDAVYTFDVSALEIPGTRIPE